MVPMTKTSNRERSISTISDLDDYLSILDLAVFSNIGGALDKYKEKSYNNKLEEPKYDPDSKLIRLTRPTTLD